MLPDFFQFSLPTKVLFQAGLAKDFSNELSQLGLTRVLFITDQVLIDTGLAAPVIEGLKNAGVEEVKVFSEVPPNSELKVVQKAAELGKEIGAEGIVALGGGSVMDTAKATNILLTLGGDLVNDYSGAHTLTQPLSPLIAIPTTSGTGSEVTKVAVILDEANSVKLSFLDRYLLPTLAILDPELTLSMPQKLTAMTGMDALTHAIESITSLEANPVSESLALMAIQKIVKALPEAVKDGKNIEARGEMLVASNMAGIAFDHAMVGVVHSMSHATGAIAHVPHGLANSILLPWGMEYNFEVAQEGYAKIAKAMGVEGADAQALARGAIQKVRDLQAQMKKLCGLSDTLSGAGVKTEQLESIAQLAVEDGSSFYNPREVVYDEVLSSLKKAF